VVAIRKNLSVIGLGVKASLSPIGGVAPFTFSVLPNGAGGTITNAGLYTAPLTSPPSPDKQIDTIRITDSLGATATTTIAVLSPIELVCEVLKRELSLQDDQVYLYNQKYNIPTDQRLYICVGFLSCKPFANSIKTETDGTTTTQSVNMQAILSISLLSKSPLARTRKEEVILALGSTFAKKVAEANNIHIAKLPTAFVNITDNEGMAMVNHFNATVAIQYTHIKVTTENYFDTFSLDEVLTNQ
jgi:hypothetical protein